MPIEAIEVRQALEQLENKLEDQLENQFEKKIVRFRLRGREHTLYDANCTGCESVDASGPWPRPHRNFGTSTCLGLVHAERFENTASQKSDPVIWCDVCGAKPDTR